MSKLFENSIINGMNLSNRFVRSATWEGMATAEGAVTRQLVDATAALARGGVGLIITGHAYVRPEGQASPWQIGIYKDELIPGLWEMTDAVHACEGKIVAQISHAGCFALSRLTGQPPMVVSDFDSLTVKPPRKELNARDIDEIISAFAEAARRAKSAGFDGVQIHSAHGYLLDQFLSPAFNKRRDEYGGDLQNRARIHLAIYNAIRETVGKDYPLLIKINCRDYLENGLDLEESLQVTQLLVDAGLDAVELSGGTFISGPFSPCRTKINSQEKEAYFKEEAIAFKKKIRAPLILVGGMRSFEVAEQLVENRVADYISLCRPLIREPNLINRWKAGDLRKSQCKSDSLCFGPGREGKGIYCTVRKDEETL